MCSSNTDTVGNFLSRKADKGYSKNKVLIRKARRLQRGRTPRRTRPGVWVMNKHPQRDKFNVWQLLHISAAWHMNSTVPCRASTT
jgi:hypothetical protein